MKKLIILTVMLLLLSGVASAISLETIYNALTGKFDYIATGNFNLTNSFGFSWDNLTDVPAGFADGVDNTAAGATGLFVTQSGVITPNESLTSGVGVINASAFQIIGTDIRSLFSNFQTGNWTSLYDVQAAVRFDNENLTAFVGSNASIIRAGNDTALRAGNVTALSQLLDDIGAGQASTQLHFNNITSYMAGTNSSRVLATNLSWIYENELNPTNGTIDHDALLNFASDEHFTLASVEGAFWKLANFTANYFAQNAVRFGNANWTSLYDAQANTRYSDGNLTSDYPNLDTDSTNDQLQANIFDNENLTAFIGNNASIVRATNTTALQADDVTAADVGTASANLDDTDASIEWEDATDLDADGSVSANAVALSTDTTGNYLATGSGTTDEIEVSGGGSEGATLTIGLPDDVVVTRNVTLGGNLTVGAENRMVRAGCTNITWDGVTGHFAVGPNC